MSINKKLAFTLAEVLITLGIIGIVAVMTIPGLMNKYQEIVTINKLKQTYSILSQGFHSMVSEYGTIDGWGNSSDERLMYTYKIFPQYFKVTEFCSSHWKSWDGKKFCPDDIRYYIYSRELSRMTGTINTGINARLHNGVIVNILYSGNCIQNRAMNKKGPGEMPTMTLYYGTYMHGCGEILVDINGNSGDKRNITSKDVFMFKIVTDGIIPAGSQKENVWLETFNDACLKEGHIQTRCTSWVLENGNMDYLRCPEKLGWDKARSCSGK